MFDSLRFPPYCKINSSLTEFVVNTANLASHVSHFPVFRMVKCRKASSKQQRAVFETWALLPSRVHNSETKLRNHGYVYPQIAI